MLAIGVDIGGTFTDIVGATADGHLLFTEVSSTQGNSY
jgi:N-methylhydantoinase A/oxoprolinase/acetone carboxylase beta subunit